MNHASLENDLSVTADREISAIEPSATRKVPRTTTLATGPLASGFSSGRPGLSDRIASDAAQRLIDNAKAEAARAKGALNELERERQVARAEMAERYRVKAEDLVAERERELARIEADFESRMAAPMSLLTVAKRLTEGGASHGRHRYSAALE